MKMKDIQKMMKQAEAMQTQMEADLDGMEVEGTAGGGMVSLVLDGKKNLKSIAIKPDAVQRGLIGEIIRINKNTDENSLECIVKPAVTISQVEEVLVIIY